MLSINSGAVFMSLLLPAATDSSALNNDSMGIIVRVSYIISKSIAECEKETGSFAFNDGKITNCLPFINTLCVPEVYNLN